MLANRKAVNDVNDVNVVNVGKIVPRSGKNGAEVRGPRAE